MILRNTLCALALAFVFSACAAQSTAPLIVESDSPDGLERVSSKYFSAAFLRPGVDLGRYSGVLIGKSELAFRTPDRSKNQFPLTSDQKQRFREMLDTQFASELAGLKKIRLSETPGPDVLALRVRVQDIAATVPPRSVGRSGWGSLVLEATGEATLVIELRDSESEEVLARVFDRRATQGAAMAQKGGPPITRWEDVEALCKRWASTVRARLDVLVTKQY